MRLAVGLLVCALGGSIASADDAKPAAPPAPTAARPSPRVPLRVVRVMPESHQALLFDRDRGTHVLAEVGTQVDGYRVDEIAEDAVTLSANGAQVVLAAPERTWRRRDAEGGAAPAPAAPVVRAKTAAPVDPYSAPATAAPADPYGDAAAPADPYAAPAPADPYAAPATALAPADPYGAAPAAAAPADPYAAVRVVEAPAPIVPGEGGIRTVEAQATPTVGSPSPSPSTPTSPVAAEDPGLALTHNELGAELADFNKLSAAIRATFTPGGVRVDSVAAGSLFARAGLRAGDVISAVDGQPLRSLDDAAELYARASSARNISITVVRAGKPASLHVTIK